MVGLMIESAQSLLIKWEQIIEEQGGGATTIAEVKVDDDLRELSADVISRVCFGHSYSKGKEVFSKIRSMKTAMSKQGGFLFGVSGFRYVNSIYTISYNSYILKCTFKQLYNYWLY